MKEKVPTRKYLVLVFIILGVLAVSGCVENQTKTQAEPAVSGLVSTGEAVGVAAEVVSPADFARVETTLPSDVGTGRGIVVSGQGRVRVTPDMAVFTAGVITTGETSQQTISRNAEIMGAVVSALKAAEVVEKDIKTQAVNVWPEFDYGTQDNRELPTIIGYRAENRVSVTVRDITETGAIIDAATSAGANQLYGLSFTVSDDTSKALRAQVLKAAVEDATEKAQAIADALGIEKISPIRVIESGGYSPPIYRYDVAALEKAAAPTPISPGETEVTASVMVTYDFES
jgi:uncharacterized protein YggE